MKKREERKLGTIPSMVVIGRRKEDTRPPRGVNGPGKVRIKKRAKKVKKEEKKGGRNPAFVLTGCKTNVNMGTNVLLRINMCD